MLITPNPVESGSPTGPALVTILLLVAVLIAKEASISVPWRQNQTVARILDVGIVPLLFVSGLVILIALVRLLA